VRICAAIAAQTRRTCCAIEQTSMPAFKQAIGWHALQDQQARDEAH